MAGTDMIPDAVFECEKCDSQLEPGQVTVSYLGSSFPVELLRCPQCGFVLITEQLALGKMLQVEKTLEDK
ncbi:DVU_1557 family redox protein [Alicyclobacillus sp. SO9]|uniref:DVU_1557 family redox protein n=1 Tax=Alicyclobacillus sp. SO9 TaxID=2665646 RepID=UPI0018E6E0E3|nr:CLJU_RS11820 family redox protein [Alicyclobacillus sp. SO9]QQE80589.1 hypothetical protein GI364_09365 [Alicyclobacillus sp. SO9]